jgi:hypothetical protein
LPVAAFAPLPLSVKFSTLAGSVYATEDWNEVRPLAWILDDHIACGIDDVIVIAGPACERVGPGPAIQGVVSAQRVDAVLPSTRVDGILFAGRRPTRSPVDGVVSRCAGDGLTGNIADRDREILVVGCACRIGTRGS